MTTTASSPVLTDLGVGVRPAELDGLTVELGKATRQVIGLVISPAPADARRQQHEPSHHPSHKEYR